jgi:hypothetical protein
VFDCCVNVRRHLTYIRNAIVVVIRILRVRDAIVVVIQILLVPDPVAVRIPSLRRVVGMQGCRSGSAFFKAGSGSGLKQKFSTK